MNILDSYRKKEGGFDQQLPENWTDAQWAQVFSEVEVQPDTTLIVLEAALFVGRKAKLSDRAIDVLCKAILKAATDREIVLIDPRTKMISNSSKSDLYDLVSAADLDAWLEKQRAPYRFQNTKTPAPTLRVADPQRRLTRLREIGGVATKQRNGEWRFQGIGKLIEEEKAAGAKRSDAHTIREDLKLAAEEESRITKAGEKSASGDEGKGDPLHGWLKKS